MTFFGIVSNTVEYVGNKFSEILGGIPVISGIPVFVRDEPKKTESNEQTIKIMGKDVKISGDAESVVQAISILNIANSTGQHCDASNKVEGFDHSGVYLIIKNTTEGKYYNVLFKNDANVVYDVRKFDAFPCARIPLIMEYNAQYQLLCASKNLFVVKLLSGIKTIMRNTQKLYPIVIEMERTKYDGLKNQFNENTAHISKNDQLKNEKELQITTKLEFREILNIDEFNNMFDPADKTYRKFDDLPQYTVTYTKTDPKFTQFNGLNRYILTPKT